LRNYRDLKVWSKAHELTIAVYAATRAFPRDEIYGITAQIRRASISIEANLAEGCGRRGDAELARFVRIAMGSASELDCHLLLACDLKFLALDGYSQLIKLLEEVRGMLTAFLLTIEKSEPRAVAKGSELKAKSLKMGAGRLH
jgi:four helix bundle protein